LLAAREWKLFAERGFDVEIILMSPAITVPAMISGEIDYFAGVGPGAASASFSGLPLRAVWVSSEREPRWRSARTVINSTQSVATCW
jgi:ABC-type nitrate/sulfonate/bicarbonate transport system substrate-binding protein